MLELAPPSNEGEFEAMMESVDRFLRDSGVPIPGRPLQGWRKVSSSLKLRLHLVPHAGRKPTEGCFSGEDLTVRIFQWFDLRYGEKLKLDFGPGSVFILLRQDPWRISLPRVWGTVEFFASNTEPSSRIEDDLRQHRVPRCNVLDLVGDLPDGMRASLEPHELAAISEHVH